MVKYVANAFRKKTNVGSLPPNKKVQGNQEKFPLPSECVRTKGEKI